MHFAYVVTIGELVNIALEVFGGHLVINAVIPAFQQAPEGLDAVGMNIFSDELACVVSNAEMLLDRTSRRFF